MSRAIRIGTIFSRVDGLLRKGVINESEKPLWYEIYKSFPPEYEPEYKRPAPSIDIKEILYPEDVVRAEIHKTFSRKLGSIDLNDNTKSYSMILIEAYQKYIDEGMSHSAALEKITQQENYENPSEKETKVEQV